MRTMIVTIGLTALAGSAAFADQRGFDAAMQQVLAEYLKIHGALAADREAGVAQSAARIEKLATRLKPAGQAKLVSIPASLRAAAAKLRQAKGIAAARLAFKELSRPMVTWATALKPSGIYVVTCSMAKASWLQREREVANPYYGSQMLRCGDVAKP